MANSGCSDGSQGGGLDRISGRRVLPADAPSPAQNQGHGTPTGLHESVDVMTDRYGVPHIYARNEDDLFFAQGYVHAQERLWQMEFNRRLGSRRLSKLFGAVALDLDRICRQQTCEVARTPINQ
ncbi:MAG: penicillin acylase family protein [Ktedonobacterales bacterium]